MKKRTFLIFTGIFLLAMAFSSKASPVDSLMQLASRENLPDTQRIRLLCDLSALLYTQDTRQADSMAHAAMDLAREIDRPASIALAHYALGAVAMGKGTVDEGLEHAHAALDFYRKEGSPFWQSKVLNLLGVLHKFRGEYEESLNFTLQSLQLAEQDPDRKAVHSILINIGATYFHMQEFGTAISYFRRGLAEPGMQGDRYNQIAAYNNLGAAHMLTDSADLAYLDFQESFRISEALGNRLTMATIVQNMANIRHEQNQPQAALPLLRKAMTILRKLDSPLHTARCAKDFGNVFIGIQQYDSAAYYLDIAEEIATNNRNHELSLLIIDKRVKLHEAQGNPTAALGELRKQMALQDSIRQNERLQQVEAMRIAYETEKKEQENALLKEKDALREAELQRNNTLLWAVLGGILLLVILLGVLWRANQRTEQNNRLLASQKQKIQEQNHRLEELNREKDGLVSIVAHDLRAPMTRVEALIDLLQQEIKPEPAQQAILDRIRNSTQEGNRFIQDLLEVTVAEQQARQPQPRTFDLHEALQQWLPGHQAHAEQKNIHLRQQLPEVPTTVRTDREYLGRILDNLLSNALKFSPSGTEVALVLEADPQSLRLRITDQGPGISPEDQTKLFTKFQKLSARPTQGESSTGLGLAIVKALVEKLKGTISVHSVPGEGATFEVTLPQNN